MYGERTSFRVFTLPSVQLRTFTQSPIDAGPLEQQACSDEERSTSPGGASFGDRRRDVQPRSGRLVSGRRVCRLGGAASCNRNGHVSWSDGQKQKVVRMVGAATLLEVRLCHEPTLQQVVGASSPVWFRLPCPFVLFFLGLFLKGAG